MKILLDECLNWRLKRDLESHEVFTVQEMGWSGILNGQLITNAINSGFQVFITIDKNLVYQQNIKKYNLSIIVLDIRLNRLEYIRLLIPSILGKLSQMVPGEVYIIS